MNAAHMAKTGITNYLADETQTFLIAQASYPRRCDVARYSDGRLFLKLKPGDLLRVCMSD